MCVCVFVDTRHIWQLAWNDFRPGVRIIAHRFTICSLVKAPAQHRVKHEHFGPAHTTHKDCTHSGREKRKFLSFFFFSFLRFFFFCDFKAENV